jgi:magnesium transporter
LDILCEIHGEDIVHKSPADSADLLERIPESSARELLRELGPPQIARIIAELETGKAASLLVTLDIDKLIATLALLPAHQIADLIPGLPAPIRDSILTRLPADISAVIQSLLRYAPDSAGGIMDHRVIKVRSDETVSGALEKLRAGYRQRSGDITYIYVVDSGDKLIGVVSLRDLVFNSADTRLSPKSLTLKSHFCGLTTTRKRFQRKCNITRTSDSRSWMKASVWLVL